ncbi:MAG: glycosyltransferase family A protein [Alphaproteobacteria bacterium]
MAAELIVVDNGSTDETAAVFEKPRLDCRSQRAVT